MRFRNPLAIEPVVFLASPAAGIGYLLPQQNDKRLLGVSSIRAGRL